MVIFGVEILKKRTNSSAKVEICATQLHISIYMEIYVYLWCTYIDVRRNAKKNQETYKRNENLGITHKDSLMKITHRINQFTKHNGIILTTLYCMATILAVAGIAVLIVFLLILKNEYQVIGDGEILLDKTAQVGDFVGGMIGSLWAFSGILLYFIAISLQRKDISSREREYSVERITNIIYNQYKVIKDAEKTLKLGDKVGELVFPYYRQFIANNMGIPLSENPKKFPDYEITEYLDFTDSTSFNHYRNIVKDSLNVINHLIDENFKIDNTLNLEVRHLLKTLMNSNLNTIQMKELFEADFCFNKYLLQTYPTKAYPFQFLREKSLEHNNSVLELL